MLSELDKRSRIVCNQSKEENKKDVEDLTSIIEPTERLGVEVKYLVFTFSGACRVE